jgi:predicted glutamine amidotransferase
MCVIIYKKPEGVITRRTLKQCWNANDDGAGYMWADSGTLWVQKGFMTFRSFYKTYRMAERAFPNASFVIHMRIRTSGRVDDYNCHPFKINSKVGFAHNGILTDYSHADSNKSDTALFCKQTLAKLPEDFINNAAYRMLIDSFCTREVSKMVFLGSDGAVFIANESMGTWNRNIWFSNLIHKSAYNSGAYPGYSYNRSLYHDDVRRCVVCDTYHIEGVMYETLNGFVCVDCRKTWNANYSDQYNVDRARNVYKVAADHSTSLATVTTYEQRDKMYGPEAGLIYKLC